MNWKNFVNYINIVISLNIFYISVSNLFDNSSGLPFPGRINQGRNVLV